MNHLRNLVIIAVIEGISITALVYLVMKIAEWWEERDN